MATYCYRVMETGTTTERVFPIGQAPDTVTIGRRLAVRDIQAEHPGGGAGHKPKCWPMESWNCGVNPDQVPELEANARKHGVPTKCNPETGDVIFTSQRHRKRFCEKFGYYDRNGGYGDPQRK